LRLARHAFRGRAFVQNDRDSGLRDAALFSDVLDRRSSHLVDNTHSRLMKMPGKRGPAKDVNRFISSREPVSQNKLEPCGARVNFFRSNSRMPVNYITADASGARQS